MGLIVGTGQHIYATMCANLHPQTSEQCREYARLAKQWAPYFAEAIGWYKVLDEATDDEDKNEG